MPGFLKLLILLCAVSKQSAQKLNSPEQQENWNRNMALIFNFTKVETQLNNNVPNCTCVPLVNCEQSSDEIELETSKCTDTLEICCPHNRLTSNPGPKPNRGCGIRNDRGLEWSMKYDITIYESNFGEFPWTVAVLKSGNYSFVGTLIHPRVVLTAANRVEYGEAYTVRAGEWNIKSTYETQKHQEIDVERVIKHPTFRKDNLQNDVALLILEQSFSLDDHINVICLPDHGADPPPGSVCYLNGWGKDGFSDLGQSIAIMKRVPFHVVGFSECQDRFQNYTCEPAFSLSNSTLYAESQKDVNMTQGDVGGPLACPFGDRYQLSGIASFVIKGNGIGSGYAKVASVRNWIDQEITDIGFENSYYISS